WSGTVDQYVHDLGQTRVETMKRQLGTEGLRSKKVDKATGGEYKPPTVDVSKLPPLSLTKTDVTERIAGYDTVKYEARTDGQLFQEFWLAPAVNVSADL